MAVSHHDDPATYKTYVINAAHVDPERDAHIGRHFNLYASGYYKPPVALSIPVAIETIKQETSEELEQLKKGQARIMMISGFPCSYQSVQLVTTVNGFLKRCVHLCSCYFADDSGSVAYARHIVQTRSGGCGRSEL